WNGAARRGACWRRAAADYGGPRHEPEAAGAEPADQAAAVDKSIFALRHGKRHGIGPLAKANQVVTIDRNLFHGCDENGLALLHTATAASSYIGRAGRS